MGKVPIAGRKTICKKTPSTSTSRSFSKCPCKMQVTLCMTDYQCPTSTKLSKTMEKKGTSSPKLIQLKATRLKTMGILYRMMLPSLSSWIFLSVVSSITMNDSLLTVNYILCLTNTCNSHKISSPPSPPHHSTPHKKITPSAIQSPKLPSNCQTPSSNPPLTKTAHIKPLPSPKKGKMLESTVGLGLPDIQLHFTMTILWSMTVKIGIHLMECSQPQLFSRRSTVL